MSGQSKRTGPDENEFIFKFGGGLNTRTPEDSLEPGEAADGRNFLIDVASSDLRPRPPIDLVATAPNESPINGGGSMRLTNGTVIAFFQAGDTVYEYDSTGLVESPTLDTVNTNSKLRGHWRTNSWLLDDEMIVTDLSLNEVVKEWDGTTWSDVSFLSNPSTSFGTFAAKYVNVDGERATYANVKDNGTTFGHIIVGSTRQDFRTLTTDDRPDEALGAGDPFFLVTPDLRPVNAYVSAYGIQAISSELGRLFRLTGTTAKDYALAELYANSYADGDESVAYVGNDVIYGRQGRIESLKATDKFGDTAADDLSLKIQDVIKDYEDWTIVFNSRLNRAYCFASGQSEVWVFDTAFEAAKISPWMRWKTTLDFAFQPTYVASMLDPADGLEYTFMGDSSGNIYRLEGTGTSGDGGTDDITTVWDSPLVSLKTQQRSFDVHGYIRYRRDEEVNVTLTCLHSGDNVFDEEINVTLPALPTSGRFYNNSLYYNGPDYYGAEFKARLSRQDFEIPGNDSTDFQLRVSVTSKKSFEISEIGLRFRGSE